MRVRTAEVPAIMKHPAKVQSAILALAIATSCLAQAAEKPIDVERSTLRIHVGKSGLFSVAGHEHWVTAPIAQGGLEEAEPSHIWFRIDAAKLTVENDKDLSPAQQAEVQRTMQTKVLDSEHYPEINFRSTSIERASDGSWLVKGDLSLHGQTHPVSTVVHRPYVGHCQIKQTAFGIHPVTVAGGTVRVKDELQIEFSIAPVRTSVP